MALMGRAAEQERLDDVLVAAREGCSTALVIRGEPGIGKSALLDYAGAQADGMWVLRSTGIEAEHELPFAGIHQLLRPCLEYIDALPDPQREALMGALGLSAEQVDDRFLISLGLLSLLAEASNDRPVLCLIDDAQWLDRASQDALVFAARRIHAEHIAFLLAARVGDPRRFAGDGLDELELGGIRDEDARVMLTERFGKESSPEVLDLIVKSANGNPLALLELPAGMTDKQLLGTEAIVGPPPARGAVEEQYRSRVAALPDETRRALLVAAADEIGDLGTIGRAAAALGVSLDDLAAAEKDGLVRTAASLEFRHPLVRSAVYRSATRSERAAAHKAIAGATEDSVRRVWHTAVITDGADESIATELEAAAAQALTRGAHSSASAAFERAAELSSEPEKRAGRLVGAAQASFQAGRLDTALGLAERARPLMPDPGAAAPLNLIQLVNLIRRGSPEDAYEVLDGVISDLAPESPGDAAELCLWQTSIGAMGGWADRALRAAGPKLDELGPDTVPARFGRPYVAGALALLDGEPERARDLFDDALEVAAEEGASAPSALGIATVPTLIAYLHMFSGDFSEARKAFAALLADHRRVGRLDHVVGIMWVCAGSEISEHRIGQAEALLDEGYDLAVQLGFDNDATGMLSVRARIAALRGDAGECRESAEEAIHRSVANGLGSVVTQAHLALAELELGGGDPRIALEHFDLLGSTVTPPFAILSTADRVDAMLRVDEREPAVAALAEFERWAAVTRSPVTLGLLARTRAMVTENPTEAEARFDEAVASHQDAPPYERARTSLAYGEWLRRERRKSEARTHLRNALELFEGLRAVPWAERAQGELRATGQRARKRDVSTADDLTPQELRIAQLVAEGATNRDVASQLFVSPKTVEYHLGKVFVKLGIGSRVELARVKLQGG